MSSTAVIYARVSDRKQAAEDISIPAQLELAEKRARELGADTLRTFVDQGRSAFKSSNRPTFEAAIEFAVLMNATYFITWSPSRFARNQIEGVLYKRDLDRAGVKLVYVSMSIDRATDEGWLVDGVLGLIDEMQSRQNAKDTRRSMMRNAQCGYWGGGRTPFGFVSVPAPDNPKRRKLQLLPGEAAIVRDIFSRRVSGFGSKSIATYLNAAGITNRGKSWCKSVLLAMLRNEAYIGAVVFNRKDRRTGRARPKDQWIIVPSHDAIVDAEIWSQVQARMDEASDASTGSPLSTHAFTGLLRCGECGASLQIETAKGRRRIYSYYNCRTSQVGRGCKTRRLRADVVDAWLHGIILERVLSRDALKSVAAALEESCRDRVVDRDRARQALRTEARTLKDRNSKLFGVLELHGKDAPDLGDLTLRLRENNARLKQIDVELAELEVELQQRLRVTDAELDLLGDTLRQLLADPDQVAKARAFYGSFISRIVLQGDQLEIRYDPARLLSQPTPVHSSAVWLPVRSPLRTAGGGSAARSATRVLVVDLPAALARAA